MPITYAYYANTVCLAYLLTNFRHCGLDVTFVDLCGSENPDLVPTQGAINCNLPQWREMGFAAAKLSKLSAAEAKSINQDLFHLSRIIQQSKRTDANRIREYAQLPSF